MFFILIILIFIRPLISSLAFAYLNLLYSGGLLVFLLAYVIYKKLSFVIIKNLIFPAALFVTTLLISLIFSQNHANSLSCFYMYISGLLLFLAAASLSEEEQLFTVQAITLCGLVISLLAIYQYLFGFSHLAAYLSNGNISFPFALGYIESRRVFFPFLMPSILGGYLATILPLFFINKNRIWLVLPLCLALILTKSIGAFLSLFLALMVYFYLQGRFKKRNSICLLVILIFLAGILILRSMTGRDNTQPIFSAVMRFSYWRDTLELIKTHPWVGVGLGNFDLRASRYAHNSYLQIWAEMGIFGLLAFAWLVYAAMKTGLRNLKQSLNRIKYLALFAASLVFLTHNFVDFTFFLPEVSFVWWVILGLIVSRDSNKLGQK